jgi:hypothetical protein
MQSLEKAQEAYEKSKHDQSSKDIERRQPKSQVQGGGREFRNTPREVRHVRYGYRQNNPGTPHRRNAADRRRNYHTDSRNVQAQELNPRIPEFQPSNMDVKERSEQAGVHTKRPTANHFNQEN